MQNAKNIFLKGKTIVENNKKPIYYVATAFLILLVIIKAIPFIIPEPTAMDVLVDRQQENMDIIGTRLQEQQKLRLEIAILTGKLDANIKQVQEIEAVNAEIRSQMINFANNLPTTSTNDKK